MNDLELQLKYFTKTLEQEDTNKQKSISISLRSLSEKVHDFSIRNEERLKITKARFNVFTCLTRYHLEELHSNFIAYLLDPKETHDCGEVFLNAFIKTIKENDALNDKLAKSNINLNNAHIFREKRTENGNIDILIEIGNFIIVIENKIYAVEQPNQIERYAKYCKNQNKEFIILYLTLYGNESKQAGLEEYFTISYSTEILKWLNTCIQECSPYLRVAIGLDFYLGLLNTNIFNKQIQNVDMNIKELLLKEENKYILKYFSEIRKAFDDICKETRNEFLYKVFLRFKNEGFNLSTVQGHSQEVKSSELWNSKYRGIRFNKKSYSLNSNTGIYFCIEQDINTLYFGLVALEDNDNGFKLLNCASFEETKPIINFMNEILNNNLENSYGWWFAWKHFYIDESKVLFGNDSLITEIRDKMDEIVDKLVNEVKEYLVAWERAIEHFKQTQQISSN